MYRNREENNETIASKIISTELRRCYRQIYRAAKLPELSIRAHT